MARIPTYRVIADDLMARIASGEFPVAGRLPTEVELADRYSVSRMTVRQAVDQLEKAKLVVRRRGSGSYVLDKPSRTRGINGLASFAEEMGSAGSQVESRVIAQEELDAAPEEVVGELGATQVVRLARVRLIDETPAAYQEAWIPFSVAPGLARDELVDGSLYRTLTSRYGVELGWADQLIAPAIANDDLASLLDERVGSPLLSIRRTTYSVHNLPIEFVRSWTRPGFPLTVRLDAK